MLKAKYVCKGYICSQRNAMKLIYNTYYHKTQINFQFGCCLFYHSPFINVYALYKLKKLQAGVSSVSHGHILHSFHQRFMHILNFEWFIVAGITIPEESL